VSRIEVGRRLPDARSLNALLRASASICTSLRWSPTRSTVGSPRCRKPSSGPTVRASGRLYRVLASISERLATLERNRGRASNRDRPTQPHEGEPR
jgi:hypothetical protein